MLCPKLVKTCSLVLKKKLQVEVNVLFVASVSRCIRRGPSFEQTWIPFIQECFVSSLVEIGSVVPEQIFRYCKYAIIISPWKRTWPFICKTWFPLTQRCFVQSFFELVLLFWRRQKCEKFTRWQKWQRHRCQRQRRWTPSTSHLSLWLMWDKKKTLPPPKKKSKKKIGIFFQITDESCFHWDWTIADIVKTTQGH